MDVIINEEFCHKLPPLQPDVFCQLEESILADGEVREPLVVWNGVLVDGHHRWQIIRRHPEIPYTVKQIDFPSKWAAFAWMYRNQLGRRNLTAEERTYFIGKLYAEQKRVEGSNNQYVQAKNENRQNDVFQETAGTAQAIAKEYGIGSRTVERAGEFAHGLDAAEEVSPGFRDAVLTRKVKVSKATVAELRKLPEQERKQAVEAIKDPGLSTPSTPRLGETE